MSVGEELARAVRGDVFAVFGRDGKPAILARHTGAEDTPWEITGYDRRWSTAQLLFMDQKWQRFGAQAVAS